MDMIRVEQDVEPADLQKSETRDAASVFPNESRTQNALGLDKEKTKEALGAVNFVTETELNEIKSVRGERPEDGTMTVNKTLAEVLEENKQAKEEKFQEVWKSMKTGKNRPLDEDELEFLDNVYSSEAAREKAQREEEEKELAAFKLARMEAGSTTAEEPEPSAPREGPKRTAEPKAKRPQVRAVVRARKAASAVPGEATEGGAKRARMAGGDSGGARWRGPREPPSGETDAVGVCSYMNRGVAGGGGGREAAAEGSAAGAEADPGDSGGALLGLSGYGSE